MVHRAGQRHQGPLAADLCQSTKRKLTEAPVADLALDAALWARRSGRSAEDEARRGLAALEKIIADEPRDASTWVEKAELEALAGDTAAATASLDRASALNGLVRGPASGRRRRRWCALRAEDRQLFRAPPAATA
jgi:hypothetical protein